MEYPFKNSKYIKINNIITTNIQKELRLKYSYKNLIDTQFLEENLPNNINEIIMLDCQRTFFAEDKLNKQDVQ